MKALTTRQYLDLTLGFGVMITVRYGLLGTGTTADMSAAAAGVVLVLIGAIGRVSEEAFQHRDRVRHECCRRLVDARDDAVK